VRYWTAQIAACFPAPELVPELEKLLDEDDFDLRYATVTALEQIDDRRVSSILQRTLERETNEEMRDLLRDALSVIVTVC
jgi:HEAT repeat protein